MYKKYNPEKIILFGSTAGRDAEVALSMTKEIVDVVAEKFGSVDNERK